MAIPPRSKFVMEGKPAPRAGVVLFCNRNSPTSHWVQLALLEKDVEGARIEWVTPGKVNSELALLNPNATAPVLTDRETILHPAGIVAEYLDERYPHPRLSPADPAARARIRMTLRRLEGEVFPQVELILGGKGDLRTARKTVADILTELSSLFPTRGWFLAAEYNLADCAWAAIFRRINELGLKLSPPVQHAIVKYAERLFLRPAFQKSLK